MAEMIIQNASGHIFNFRVVAPVNNSIIQPSTSVPLPNSKGDKTLIFRFFGQQEEVDIDFVLYPSETDLSSSTAPAGTFPTGVKTVKEQQIYLRDFIYGARFDDAWIVNLPSMYSAVITGTIENMTFDAPPGSRSEYRTGRMKFRRGRVLGA